MNKQKISKLVLAGMFAALTAVILIADIFNGAVFPGRGLSTIQLLTDSSRILNNQTFEKSFMNISGIFSQLIDMRSYFNDIDIFITDDKYVVTPYEKTDTDYEVSQTTALKKYLDEKGINLIYVNQPTKYIDDDFFVKQFGTETYSNRNADLFLSRISDLGVNCIDLRDEAVRDGKDLKSMFYRTDHHWTVESGLWGAEKIASALNEYAGYDIDLSIYDKEKYNIRRIEKCWVGEQGTKMSEALIGKEDFTIVTPDFSTSFRTLDSDRDVTFDDLIDWDIYNESDASGRSFHYSYGLLPLKNKNVDKGKVLMLCDSFANVSEPFLAIGVSEIYPVILRNTDSRIPELIESGDYDTVIICYVQTMIGAHDDIDSANYTMFDFLGEPAE